jgi:hypothetical protein
MNGGTPASAFIDGLKKPNLKPKEKALEPQPQQTAA